MGGWYNGFSWSEREKGGAGIRQHLKEQGVPDYEGPCMLCGDPEVPLRIHAEDYAEPYLSGPPGFYWLCDGCHMHKLHKRFSQPDVWHAFRAHVRRGGYARDLKDSGIQREIREYRDAQRKNEPAELRTLRERALAKEEWFDTLSMDPRVAQPGCPKPNRARAAT